MSWINRLQEKWGVKSVGQVIIILIVFACTGFTVVLIKPVVTDYITDGGQTNDWFKVVYWILIFPFYNVILLTYGFLFGQFDFFWAYEKKMINRFRRKKNDTPAQ